MCASSYRRCFCLIEPSACPATYCGTSDDFPPPMPPSPPPPPSLPPGEYDGGTHGYYAHYTYRPWHVDEPPNHRMSINDVLHEAGREAK